MICPGSYNKLVIDLGQKLSSRSPEFQPHDTVSLLARPSEGRDYMLV